MVRITTLAVSTLNQWAMDFRGNYDRVKTSVIEAKEKGAKYLAGPELEVPGYGCEDHFYEDDTYLHSYEVLANLLSSEECSDIIVNLGMPVKHNDALYICRVIVLNGKILLIRPKTVLRDYGNYRETRWFTPWTKLSEIEEFHCPQVIQEVTKQTTVPFGDAIIATKDTLIGFEDFMELTTGSSMSNLDLEDVEIVVNSNAECHELNKDDIIETVIKSRTTQYGGVYLYSNLRGCDGGPVYYNGMSSVSANGKFLAASKQFSLQGTEVTTATVDLDDVKKYRGGRKLSLPRTRPKVDVDFALCGIRSSITAPFPLTKYSLEEQVCFGSACWLWDYLRRSGQSGFFLPLSGGIDSSSCAAMVYAMCSMICNAATSGDNHVVNDVRKIVGDSEYSPSDPKRLCNEILMTCYLGTVNSSKETRARSNEVAADVGSYHRCIEIDSVVSSSVDLFEKVTGKRPRFLSQGGCDAESLALQNVQARQRMVLSYLFAQLTLWERGRPGGLLVLGTGNGDECLTGYFTKYDCSSSDINPIGTLGKSDLKAFLSHAAYLYGLHSLRKVATSTPTPELQPLEGGQQKQTDEGDMGMTYEEIGTFGFLRKIRRCGPFSMFCKLSEYETWYNIPGEAAAKIKHFFRRYSMNRHKMATMTPSLHASSASCDDHRNDHRQILYNTQWEWQFTAIDDKLQSMRRASSEK